jgi:hypothetical protein
MGAHLYSLHTPQDSLLSDQKVTPKLERCDDNAPPAWDDNDDGEVTLVSDTHPFFTTVMS